jgi:hypothetical protein
MRQEKTSSETPLTESQARALAAWWHGRYFPLKSQPERAESVHGVQLPMALGSEVAVIYFVEQAKLLENHRNDVNLGAPDWVG